MKWILVIGIVVLALGLAPFIIGRFVPGGHVARGRAAYRQSPEALWSVVAEFEAWPKWNSSVQNASRAADRDGKPVWNFGGKWGDMPSIIDVFEPPRRLVTRIPEDAGLGFRGTWTYEIEPSPGGATLTITEGGEVDSPMFRTMMLFQDKRAPLFRFMKDLGKSFGEEVAPAAVE